MRIYGVTVFLIFMAVLAALVYVYARVKQNPAEMQLAKRAVIALGLCSLGLAAYQLDHQRPWDLMFAAGMTLFIGAFRAREDMELSRILNGCGGVSLLIWLWLWEPGISLFQFLAGIGLVALNMCLVDLARHLWSQSPDSPSGGHRAPAKSGRAKRQQFPKLMFASHTG